MADTDVQATEEAGVKRTREIEAVESEPVAKKARTEVRRPFLGRPSMRTLSTSSHPVLMCLYLCASNSVKDRVVSSSAPHELSHPLV